MGKEHEIDEEGKKEGAEVGAEGTSGKEGEKNNDYCLYCSLIKVFQYSVAPLVLFKSATAALAIDNLLSS